MQSINASPLTECPACKSEALVRGPGGGIGLQFKGTGFYLTDYGRGDEKKDPPKSCGGACSCKDK